MVTLWRAHATGLVALLLAGCTGTFLPGDGPLRGAVIEGASIRVQDGGPGAALPYALIGVSPAVLNSLAQRPPAASFRALPRGGRPAANRIGIGDILSLTVFEQAPGGLFIPADAGSRPGNYVQLPPQQVDQAGRITVPFAGAVQAAGRSPMEIQVAIQNRLAGRALEPQVVVSITEQHANVVSVLGDVGQSTRFTLDGGGERVLGAIARGGGPKFPAYESMVSVQRGGVVDRAMLSAISDDPALNLQLQPGDTVIVSHEPRYFLSLGATGITQSIGLVNKRVPFEDTALSLADGLAKVGGLQDDRANPKAVFLYRYEPRAMVERIMGASAPPALPDEVPTVYAVDLSRPDGFFLASRLQMRGEDVIFVSNAPSAELSKFLALLLPLGYTAASFRSGFQ